MAAGFVPIDYYRIKFYQRGNDSKSFDELTEDELYELSKKVSKKQEIMNEISPSSKSSIPKLERYYKTLQYLISSNIHLEYPTFDERVAFLILMTDPELILYKEFLKTDLISLAQIDKAKTKKEKEELTLLRNRSISEFESRVREQLGFYDSKMLKYEELFFKRFYSDKELITEVNRSSQDSLMSSAKSLTDFNRISDDRYAELVGIAQGWLSLVPEKQNSKVATYSVINQKKLLGLNNLSEQLALFILLVDSNLDMLRIYEEESKMQNVEKRIVEEFGYFSEDLLVLEKKFHNRFCPEKKLSAWTKTKKD